MTRDRIIEVSKIAAARVADERAGAPASVKLIARATELRLRKQQEQEGQKTPEPERMHA